MRTAASCQRRAVRSHFRGDDGDLELARQVAELRHEVRHLADQFGPGARVHDLVRRSAGILVGRNVADALAAGLDGTHLDRGELGQQVGRLLQLDPVVLDVLARGDVTIAAIVDPRDMGELAHLAGVERAIGDRHPQHVGVQLEIEPVLQPKRLELVVGQLALNAAVRPGRGIPRRGYRPSPGHIGRNGTCLNHPASGVGIGRLESRVGADGRAISADLILDMQRADAAHAVLLGF